MKVKNYLLINSLFVMLFLGFVFQFEFVEAQVSGEHLIAASNFLFEEYAEKSGSNENVSTVEISLPSNNWNITNLHLNFSNIKLERELKIIEDQAQGTYGRIYYDTPSKRRHGLGVQIKLNETTTIFGVDIYAYKPETTTQVIQVQIRGFDSVDHKPNDTIYAFTDINVSSVPGWYYQNFNSRVTLESGNYYLVMFGIVSGDTEYYWAYNGVDPKDPTLYAAEYTSNWLPGTQSEPYLYKLAQKVNKSYNPEELNMTAVINGLDYPILNSSIPNSGELALTGLNWATETDSLNIEIKNHLNIQLNFSLNYYLNIKSGFICTGSVSIETNRDNLWNITPSFNEVYENYFIKFVYPSNWNNLTVYRNNVNISSLIFDNSTQNTLFIYNGVIIDGAEWLISANSPRFNFDLDIRLTEYGPGQELRFSIDTPVTPGNYTFVLYRPDYYEVSRQTISLPSDANILAYNIPAYPLDGSYYAYIYFFNGLNAGVETATFTITVPFTIDPLSLFLIILGVAVFSGVTISIIIVAKRHKRKVMTKKEEIINKCMDILNLKYIMIAEKKSSLNVYEQVFTSQKIDPTLITGFLSAIHSFGIELTNTDEKTQTIKLEFKNSKVIMSEFRDFRIVLIMNQLPSEKFLDSINQLAFDIELYYGRYLEKFKGNIDPFKGIEDLLKKHLNISFLYPLKVVKTGKHKVDQVERTIIGRALEVMKRNKQNYFYTTHIMETKQYDSKDIEAIFNLIEKKIFQPVI